MTEKEIKLPETVDNLLKREEEEEKTNHKLNKGIMCSISSRRTAKDTSFKLQKADSSD